MESRGTGFLEQVSSNMDTMSTWFNTKQVDVTNKDADQVLNEIVNALGI